MSEVPHTEREKLSLKEVVGREDVRNYFVSAGWREQVLKWTGKAGPLSVENRWGSLHAMATVFALEFCRKFPNARNLTPGSVLSYGNPYSDDPCFAGTVSHRKRTSYEKMRGLVPLTTVRIKLTSPHGQIMEKAETKIESLQSIKSLYPSWIADEFLDLVGKIQQ